MYVFLTAIFLSLSCFGEVPHSYVTDNPNTQINKVETIKEREKAELNLSVTKVKSKELSGQIDESNKRIILTLPEEFHNKSLVVVEGLEELPNPSTVQGRKILTKALNNRQISDNLSQKVEKENLIVNYENKPEKLYISDLNGNFYKWDSQIQPRDPGSPGYKGYINKRNTYNGYINFEIDDRYDGSFIYMKRADYYNTSNEKGLKFLNANRFSNKNYALPELNRSPLDYLGEFKVNDIMLYQAGNNTGASYTNQEIGGYEYTIIHTSGSYPNKIVKINDELEIEIKPYGRQGQIRLIKYPKHDFNVKLFFYGVEDDSYSTPGSGDHGGVSRNLFYTSSITTNLNFKYIVRTLEGQSVLTAKEYYPVNQFINFNSTTMEAGSPLALENSLRDVSLTTSGKGIVTMEQG
ncbi:MAG: hypothetical protein ACLT40_11585, partial [Fusobacterium sp.]